MPDLAQFMTEVACPSCGQTGGITWDGVGSGRKLISMSPGFHLMPGTDDVVCDKCGATQPD